MRSNCVTVTARAYFRDQRKVSETPARFRVYILPYFLALGLFESDWRQDGEAEVYPRQSCRYLQHPVTLTSFIYEYYRYF